jgi:phenylacetate-coenzyme A ligase PaaK-like adenylate-forming protein
MFATSGSTGAPGVFLYSHGEFVHWIAVSVARLARFGVGPTTRLVAIGAPSDVHITRQLFAAFQADQEGVPRLSVAMPIAEIVAALNEYKPEAVIAYASVLGALAEEQLERRLTIRPRLSFATSAVLTQETTRRVEAAWGIEPISAYAATEAPAIAIGSLAGAGLHISEESVLVEVVDDACKPVAPGRPGTKVLLTNLVNRVQPLIRYELVDAVTLAEGPVRAVLRAGRRPPVPDRARPRRRRPRADRATQLRGGRSSAARAPRCRARVGGGWRARAPCRGRGGRGDRARGRAGGKGEARRLGGAPPGIGSPAWRSRSTFPAASRS